MTQVTTLRRNSARANGFTLLELLVVLVILAMLAAIATPQVIKYLGHARVNTAKVQVQALSEALDLYKLDVGRYPTAEEGLNALVTSPPNLEKWDGPYVKHADSLIDPWGNPYHYRVPGQHGRYDIWSYGADNAEGGTGDDQDITSW